MFNFLIFDPAVLIYTFGYIGLFAIVFAESGLFFGFFLPGDSLLFTAGLLASQGLFNIFLLVGLIILAAVLGDNFGYWFGSKLGPAIFTKDDSFFFNKKYIEKTQKFFIKHGSRAIIFARFVPVVRTFTPILAGVGKMPYSLFVQYNIIGGIIWGAGITFLGYFLGSIVPNIDKYLSIIIIGIIIISFIPIVIELLKNKK